MSRSLGSASSIPGEGTPQTPTMEAARGGEAEPNDTVGSQHEDQTPDRGGDARSTSSDRPSVPGRHLVLDRSEFGPSNVQLALAHAHVAWAKRHAPHLLEEWLR